MIGLTVPFTNDLMAGAVRLIASGRTVMLQDAAGEYDLLEFAGEAAPGLVRCIARSACSEYLPCQVDLPAPRLHISSIPAANCLAAAAGRQPLLYSYSPNRLYMHTPSHYYPFYLRARALGGIWRASHYSWAFPLARAAAAIDLARQVYEPFGYLAIEIAYAVPDAPLPGHIAASARASLRRMESGAAEALP